MEDEEGLDNLLRTWDLPTDVVENFKKNDINKTHLKYLMSNDTYLKELCPHIGHRIKLKTQIQEHLAVKEDLRIVNANCPDLMQVDQDSSNLQTDITSDLEDYINIPIRLSLPEFDLKTILQSTPQGNSVLNYYNKYKQLNAQKRNIIVDVVVKYHYTFIINNNIKPEEFNLIAAKIVTLFPTECVYTYYMRAVPTSKSVSRRYVPAKGKLVDKVRNLLYVSGTKRRSNSTASIDTDSVPNSQETAVNDDIIWLKNNNEPWERVVDIWNNTYNYRCQQNFKSVFEFLQEWNILKDRKADILILLDFERQYKEKSLNFYKNWEPFFSKLLSARECTVSNSDAKALIESLGDINDNDKKLPVQMRLLSYLVPPKGRKSRKEKISTSESAQSLLIETNNAGDIEDLISKQKARAAARGDTVQPYVLIQGPLVNFSQIYIIVDDVKYHMHSAAKAFDLLFKLYHVFHAKYPKAAEHLYLIIQKKIYQINTVYDSVPPYIIDILNLDI